VGDIWRRGRKGGGPSRGAPEGMCRGTAAARAASAAGTFLRNGGGGSGSSRRRAELRARRGGGIAAEEAAAPQQGVQESLANGSLAAGGPAHAGPPHVSVLRDEVRQLFAQGGLGERPVVVDGTLGAGGHAVAVLEALAGRRAHLVGVDVDPSALELARERVSAAARHGGHRVDFVRGNFSALPALLRPALGEGAQVDGLLLDLGVSSMQLDTAGRGFSFRADAPLDMRMDPSQGRSARELVSETRADLLEMIFREYGQERNARRLAELVVAARRERAIETTLDLVRAMAPALDWKRAAAGGAHPATKVFQAIRMAVNAEHSSLEQVLRDAPALLRPGGLLVVISFHSIEDSMVKRALKGAAWERAAPRPLEPSRAELETNVRSRSAKLRFAFRAEQRPPDS
jgi:16S rRNA (cytosine1402-N4)-methyltransferase